MSKEDAYKEVLDRLRPDIARICDGLKAALSAEPAPEIKEDGLRDAARRNFSRRPMDESGSMQGAPLTAKQQIELLAIMVAAANKAGLQIGFPSPEEPKANAAGPNVTPFKPR